MALELSKFYTEPMNDMRIKITLSCVTFPDWVRWVLFILVALVSASSFPLLAAENVITQSRTLQPFTAIHLSGIGTLNITQSKQEGLTIEAPPEILPLIKVYVKERTLYLDVQNASAHSDAKINYYLKIKELHVINMLSSATVLIKDILESDNFTLTVGSFGIAKVNINAAQFTANIEGGGKVEASGNADEATIAISGAGEFNGKKLSLKNADVQISGAGIVFTNASEVLSINIAGEGTVKYCQNPSITKKITGKGTIEALSESDCHQ